jgi:pyoverdine/dityrosine biosynthesis protein Dit1
LQPLLISLSSINDNMTVTKMLTPSSDDYIKMADAILSVIEGYRLKASPFNPAIIQRARSTFLPILTKMVQNRSPVQLVLPAFPFKSPNSVEKVLGVLPDKGEEVSLAHLQGLCDAIADVYEPGARLTIVSDGIVYSGKYLA